MHYFRYILAVAKNVGDVAVGELPKDDGRPLLGQVGVLQVKLSFHFDLERNPPTFIIHICKQCFQTREIKHNCRRGMMQLLKTVLN